jgi:NADH-quinone oxidoreductase subunit M
MTGPVAPSVQGFKDLNVRELTVIGPLLALIIALGFVPSLLTNYINPAINQTPAQVRITHQQQQVGQNVAQATNGSGQ